MPSKLVASAASGIVLGALALGCDRPSAGGPQETVGKDPSAGAGKPAAAVPAGRAAGAKDNPLPVGSAKVDAQAAPKKAGEMACGGVKGCGAK